MEFLDKDLMDYVEQHSAPENALLQKINRDTHAHVLMPRMLSGHLQGRILATFSHMIRPAAILEIGTYTGYSALCMAEGLQPDGVLHTIDINEELEDKVRGFFAESAYSGNIHYHIGNALDIIPGLTQQWDLVFIDADKINYARYYQQVIDQLRPGGFIIADNVLWSGKVIGEKTDKDTEALRGFNRMVHEDERVENVLFPVRDGLMVLRKV
ncbi:O-methyltransferase [Nafulsella turpanensis]|uniref:O-methyltransferase n=1 Tax=Nafulsella turpanensis TaxID=1265690 RepID=UPI000345E7C9|nr:O-methyltransferase [Nafulsella turpanensis]